MEFINYDSDVVLLIFSILSTVSLRGLPMVVEIFSEYLLVWSSIRRIVKVAVACQRSIQVLGVGIRGNKLLQLQLQVEA